MKRRDFLLGSVGALGACQTGPIASPPLPPSTRTPLHPKFHPVKATKERVIRSVVGLRPFRKSGFRLEAERLGSKTIIHNYGHGGGGVSLAWGCSEEAAKLARPIGQSKIAVLGSGVMGLTTARVLQQMGASVTVYAEAFPPDTTSNIAAAMWYPTTLFEQYHVPDTWWPLFHRCSARSFRRYQAFANDPRYGVFWIRQHNLHNQADGSIGSPMPGGNDIYPGLVRGADGNGPFGYSRWSAYQTLMIDPDIYLRALVQDFLASGGKMISRRFETPDDVRALRENTIMNCTGLGAAKLFDDPDLIPARGQLTLLLPQDDIDYGYSTYHSGVLYMFPRKSAIILGGSIEKGNWSLDIDPAAEARMLQGHADLARGLTRA